MADTRLQSHQAAGKQHLQPWQQHDQDQHGGSEQQQKLYAVVKAVTAATLGGSLLVLSSLTLVGTVVGLTLATPLMVIFSPVLVPAAITVFLILTGFLASGGFGVASIGVLAWIYRYVTGKNPAGADHIDAAQKKITGTAKDLKDKAEQYGHEATGGGRTGTTAGTHH